MKVIKKHILKIISASTLLIFWQILSMSGSIPKFMLPSPIRVGSALLKNFPVILEHTKFTLIEAFGGLLIGLIMGFALACLMDNSKLAYKSLYPILIITQTIPTIAIAPILVLWLGYEFAPRITLVVITCFFPITVSLLDGFKSVSRNELNLFRSMNANRWQTFIYLKLPSSLVSFFSGLKICTSYAVISAFTAEWISGFSGLGAYMVRTRKAFEYDKMFAVVVFISILSLILTTSVDILKKVLLSSRNPSS